MIWRPLTISEWVCNTTTMGMDQKTRGRGGGLGLHSEAVGGTWEDQSGQGKKAALLELSKVPAEPLLCCPWARSRHRTCQWKVLNRRKRTNSTVLLIFLLAWKALGKSSPAFLWHLVADLGTQDGFWRNTEPQIRLILHVDESAWKKKQPFQPLLHLLSYPGVCFIPFPIICCCKTLI